MECYGSLCDGCLRDVAFFNLTPANVNRFCVSGSLWSVTEACGILRMLVVCDGCLLDITVLDLTPANINRFRVSGSLWDVTEARGM